LLEFLLLFAQALFPSFSAWLACVKSPAK